MHHSTDRSSSMGPTVVSRDCGFTSFLFSRLDLVWLSLVFQLEASPSSHIKENDDLLLFLFNGTFNTCIKMVILVLLGLVICFCVKTNSLLCFRCVKLANSHTFYVLFDSHDAIEALNATALDSGKKWSALLSVDTGDNRGTYIIFSFFLKHYFFL